MRSPFLPHLVGAFICLVMAIIAVYPPWREALNRKINRPYRKILSSATGRLDTEIGLIKVLKIKTLKGLFLEVYQLAEGKPRPLIARIQLPDHRDGYFHFRGDATNLALDDIDGDESLEILAPTFDQNLDARLNVYTYNSETKSFEPLQK